MTTPTRLFDLPHYQAAQTPGINIFNSFRNGVWEGISTTEFIQQINDITKSLMTLGVKPNDKVGLISENRLEWNLFDLAIQQAGAVVVAIYPNISDADYEFILNDAAIEIVFVSNDLLYNRVDALRNKINLKKVYSFNEYEGLIYWKTILEAKNFISDEQLEERKSTVSEDDLATLIYTSGTTGNPKGVMLSHKNLLSDLYSSRYSFPISSYDKALTFLPACHAYERVFHYVYMYIGVSIYYAQSMDTIGQDLQSVKPNVFSAVPRVLEKVYEKIMAQGEQLTGLKRKLFYWAISLGEQYDLETEKLGFWYNFQLKIARKLIFSKWKDAMGGNVKAIGSGSATLQIRLLRLFLAAGIPVFEGYGLTEGGPCLAVNCYKRGMKIGTVGVPLKNIDLKLAEDGEILAKGDNIMLGYYNNPEATAETLKDGWLHTGDIGQWDGKFLRIIDRKKEMFKTSGGKYIVPQQLEAKLSESYLIEQIMVVGEGRKFAGALIVPAYDKLNEWLKSKTGGLGNLNPEELIRNLDVKAKISEEIKRLNAHFGNWERIKDFVLLPSAFSIETGELTPTLKIKRKVVEKKYQQLIDQLYLNAVKA